MNNVPPSEDLPDDIDELYRGAAARDDSRPSEFVQPAILEHAARLAAERSAHSGTVQESAQRGRADNKSAVPRRESRWGRRGAIIGTLAAAGLAGLLVTPQLMRLYELPLPPTVIPSTSIFRKAAPAPSASSPAPSAPSIASSSAQRQTTPAPPPRLESLTPVPQPKALAKAAPPAGDADYASDSLQNVIVTARARTPARSSPEGEASGAASTVASAAARSPPVKAPTATPAPTLQELAPRATAWRDGTASLRHAAVIGDVSGLQTLLEQATNINAPDTEGRTALMLAVMNGQARAVDVLLMHGADVNAADHDGITPYRAALAGNHASIASALRRAGGH